MDDLPAEVRGGLEPPRPMPVPPEMNAAIEAVSGSVDVSSGLVVRNLAARGFPMAVLYIDDLVDAPRMESAVLKPLLFAGDRMGNPGASMSPEAVLRQIVVSARGARLGDIKDVVWSLFDGSCVLVAEGWREALAFEVETSKRRPIEEPQTEVTVRGPREGFVEDLSTNLSLIRRRVRHPWLRIERLTVGRLSRSDVAVVYLQGVTRLEVVSEVMSRLKRIDVDAVSDAAEIEEFIEDSPFSPFPQIGLTERPDRAAMSLLQGCILVLVSESPFALVAPFPVTAFLQAADDYYQRWAATILGRTTRLVSMLISLLLPSGYVAFTTFHPEVIPRPLALALAVQREMVPYPAIVEALAITLVFEIVTEASIRLPRPMGQTVGIVGALVIGESAVRANLISNVMVIVVAATALAQFTVMHQLTITVRLLRLPLLVLSSILGLFGIFFGLILILLHLAALRTMGLPYLAPYAPLNMVDMKDATVRLPWWTLNRRPSIIGRRNPVRIPPGQKPEPPAESWKRMELEADTRTRMARAGSARRRRFRPHPVMRAIRRIMRRGR